MEIEEVISLCGKNNKINIIGPPGSGKTTLSKKLSFTLNRELIEMDKLLFNENCQLKKNRLELLLNEINQNNRCIVDGTYFSLLTDKRIKSMDHFIVCEANFFKSAYRIIKRQIKSKSELFCGEKLSFKLIKYLVTYHLYKKREIIKKLPEQKISYVRL